MIRPSKYPGVYEMQKGKRKTILLTKNLCKGKTVYQEQLIKDGGEEYRTWDPGRSKLAAGILNEIKNSGIKVGDTVLYLGSASGTTVSHVSDIVGKDGFVFALDFAPRVVRDLVFVCEDRKNIAPLFANANHPEEYKELISAADVIFMDIAQKNQTEIFLKNINMFLKKGAFALLSLKARSVDVTKKPNEIYKRVKGELSQRLDIVDTKRLEPHEKDHMLFVCRKR